MEWIFMRYFRVPSRTHPRTLSKRENNFIQIKEKNMYYYQFLNNQ